MTWEKDVKSWEVLPNVLGIAGVELTQATQYFFINGQGSNFADNNSVPLVSQRALVLRVYVDDQRPHSLFPRWVSGRVRYWHGASPQVTVLDPLNGSVRARPIGAVDRGQIGDTLNFRIPAEDCHHMLRIVVDLFDPSTTEPEVGLAAANTTSLSAPQTIIPTDSKTFFVHFRPAPAFAVRVVLIRYRGGGLDLPAPSGWQFASDLVFTLDTFPIGRLTIGDCVVTEFDGDLRVDSEWQRLWTRVSQLNHNSSEICVGLLPKGVPGSIRGIGGGGVAVAVAGEPETLAQEIGHALGLLHTPNPGTAGGFGGPPNVDPNYPRYDSYLLGSIGEYGVRRTDLSVFDPRSWLDLMSYDYTYFRAGWVSPYTYMKLWGGMISRFGTAWSASLAPAVPRSAWLYLEFSIDRSGAVALQPSFIRETSPAPTVGFSATPISCELMDAKGRVIHRQRCTLRDPYQDVDGPSLFFYEAIPWSSNASAIQFRRETQILETIDIEDAEPRLTVAPPKVTAKTVTIEWGAEQSGQRPFAFLVEYSSDDGRSWRTLARSSDTRCEFDVDVLPGGEQCRFRVLASSGVRTALAESAPFALRQKPRRAFILSPARDEQVAAGQNLILRGGGFAPGAGLADPKDTLWMSSVDGALGYGHEVVARVSEGLHTITVIVPDGVGGRASADVTVFVRGGASDDQRDDTRR